MTKNTQKAPEMTPVRFVGQPDKNTKKNVKSIHVRCEFKNGRREICKTIPFEELPLARMLYRTIGGRVRVIDGLEDPSYARYSVQHLTEGDMKERITRLMAVYDKREIGGVEHNFFSDTYGNGASSIFVQKAIEIVKKFPKEQMAAHRAEVIESIADEIFPHTAIQRSTDVINVAGLEGLEMPEVGADVDDPNEDPGAAFLEGDGENGLIVYCSTVPKRPLSKKEATILANILATKPVDEFDEGDMKALGMDMRSHQRIMDMVADYYVRGD